MIVPIITAIGFVEEKEVMTDFYTIVTLYLKVTGQNSG
jgi:hypothetical protein